MNSKYYKKTFDKNDEFTPVASDTDFTGLIPAGLNSTQELEAYNEMYKFIPPTNVSTNNKGNTTK